ncbi:MAG: hypothetical protein AAGE80_05515 [Pseudomonadota bacterium]
MISRTIVILLMLAAPASAQTSYDWTNGNTYTVLPDSSGSTVEGRNARTGSDWRIRQNSDGTYNGRDADGNLFQGNQRTGEHYNFGTGRSCYGKGYSRICN